MKFNKILIVSIFLAVLAIGCVSASDNLTSDALATDGGDFSSLAQADDSCGVLKDSYYDDDFYITVKENYSYDENEWESNDIIYIYSSGAKNTTINVLVNDSQKESFTLTEGYFSVEDDGYGGTYNNYIKFIYPTDLGLNVGKYNIKVKSDETTFIDTNVTLKYRDDFDIWIQNPYYCLSDYWNSSSFIAIDSNHLNNGALEIYVNGTRKVSYNVSNGDFPQTDDCSNKSRYLAASDLIDDYGSYNIKICFTENGVTETLRDENVVVAVNAPTTDPKLEVYFDLYTVELPADNIAHIYLPWEATGNLTVSYNNVVNQSVEYENGIGTHYIYAYNLNHLGENNLTFTYTGDDFGTLTATASCTVIPKITAPYYVSVGENFTISMATHEWANGDFNVYDYNDGVKGNLLASSWIHSYLDYYLATATVTLSANTSGVNRYYLEFDYPGGDYPLIQEVYLVENSQNVSVDVLCEIESGSDLNVTVNAPADYFTFAQISVDGGDADFVMLEDGEALKTISNLTDGYHTVKVFYQNQYYVDGEWRGDIYLNTFTVNVGVRTDLTSDDIVCCYNSGENLKVKLTDIDGNVLANQSVVISLDGTSYTGTTDVNGEYELPIDLLPGNYSADISFAGCEGYLSSSVASTVTVNKMPTELTAGNVSLYYGVNKALFATLKDINNNALANKSVVITLNGADYIKTTNKYGQISFGTDSLPGNYSADISFAGDEIYDSSNCTAEVYVLKSFSVFEGFNTAVEYYGPNLDFTCGIVLDDKFTQMGIANRNVTFIINGTEYVNITDSEGYVSITVELYPGNYSLDINFAGDECYSESGYKNSFFFSKMNTDLTVDDVDMYYGDDKNLIITLKDAFNNTMANKSILITLNGANYTETTDENGQASIPIYLDCGSYQAEIYFEGDSSYNSSSALAGIFVGKIPTALTAQGFTGVYGTAKNLVITLKDNNGNVLADRSVIIKVAGLSYIKTTGADGQIKLSLNLPAKSYSACIIFSGDDYYVASSADAKIVVNKAATKLTAKAKSFKVKAKSKKVTATLKNNKGKVMKGYKLKLTVNKKTYTAKTNKKGVATFKVKVTKKGTYKAVYKYAGNSNYKTSSKTVKIKIK